VLCTFRLAARGNHRVRGSGHSGARFFAARRVRMHRVYVLPVSASLRLEVLYFFLKCFEFTPMPIKGVSAVVLTLYSFVCSYAAENRCHSRPEPSTMATPPEPMTTARAMPRNRRMLTFFA